MHPTWTATAKLCYPLTVMAPRVGLRRPERELSINIANKHTWMAWQLKHACCLMLKYFREVYPFTLFVLHRVTMIRPLMVSPAVWNDVNSHTFRHVEQATLILTILYSVLLLPTRLYRKKRHVYLRITSWRRKYLRLLVWSLIVLIHLCIVNSAYTPSRRPMFTLEGFSRPCGARTNGIACHYLLIYWYYRRRWPGKHFH